MMETINLKFIPFREDQSNYRLNEISQIKQRNTISTIFN